MQAQHITGLLAYSQPTKDEYRRGVLAAIQDFHRGRLSKRKQKKHRAKEKEFAK